MSPKEVIRTIPSPDRLISTVPVQAAVQQDSVLRDLSQFLRGHWLLILASTALGLGGAWVFTRTQPPLFRAAASIEIQDFNENFLNLKDITPVSSSPETPFGSDLQTQLRILQSNTLIERVLQHLPVEQHQPPLGVRAWWSRVRGNPRLPPAQHDEVLENAARNLGVRESRQARIVDLTYDSEDPQYAAAFVNGLARQYIDQNIESRLEISRNTTTWLERQLDDLRGQLQGSEDRLQKYARGVGLLATGDQRPDADKFRQIQENLSKAQENRMILQARMETAAKTPVEALESQPSSTIREYQAKLTDLRRQRADLAAVYTSNFDGVKRLDEQIRVLETALRTESGTVLDKIRADYTDSVRREKLLEDSYADQLAHLSKQEESVIQYGYLKREVDTNAGLYQTMLQRVAEARVASAFRASNARLVDPAKPPRLPFKPNGILNLLWGGSAGLLLGMVLATVREHSSRPPLRPGDLSIILRVPELGTIPKISLPSRNGSGPHSLFSEIALASWTGRTSPVAGSFREIVTSIALSTASGRAPKVIVVTSAKAGEGKTTLLTNIAGVLANLNRKVLLIDANLHNPRLHQVFDQPNDYGFADLLTLPGDNSSLLSYVTRPTSLPSVSLATPGPHASGAMDLLYGRALGALVARAREEFDLVLIDTPAMQDLPDARILGRLSDGVILVAQATDRDAITSATARLQQDGTPVLGTVLNNFA